MSRDVCRQIELETNNLIFTLQTFKYFEASCLAIDALCNFHGNQDICQRAIELCASLCAKVLQDSTNKSPKKCIFGQILCSIGHSNIGKVGEAPIIQDVCRN